MKINLLLKALIKSRKMEKRDRWSREQLLSFRDKQLKELREYSYMHSVRLEKILNVSVRKDGVELDKDAGKVPILKTKKDPEIAGRILKRLLRSN